MPLIPNQDLQNDARAVADSLAEFTTMLVLGIGGSSLGLRALVSALPHPASPYKGEGRTILICDDLDPLAFQQTTQNLDWKKTVVNIVSKSGETLEVMAFASVVVDRLKKSLGHDWTSHVVVTTDPQSGYLRQWATQNALKTCQIPPDVGGRFSVFTTLLPLMWAGYDVAALLAGAQKATTESQKMAEQHVAWDREGRSMMVIMPYSSHLIEYARWFVQLWAESLGKNQKGQTPMIAMGTADQHTQLQMFVEGPQNKCIRFMVVKSWPQDITISEPIDPNASYLRGKTFAQLLETAAHATAAALKQAGCPSYTVTLPELNEFTLGHLMMGDMRMTLAAAQLYGVDPNGQPGVELGKKLWRESLSA